MKKKGGSSKKDKAVELVATDEATGAFGLQVQDLVRTPLGLLVTVLGVKYDDPQAPDTGRLWVRYDNGHEAPLEPRAGAAAGSVSQLGYSKCSEAAHIRRDVAHQQKEQAKHEEQGRIVQEVMRLKDAGLPIPGHLLPRKAKMPVEKEAKGGKKKGKG